MNYINDMRNYANILSESQYDAGNKFIHHSVTEADDAQDSMLREVIEEAKLTVDYKHKTRLALNMTKTAHSTLNSHNIKNTKTHDLS